MTGSQESQRDGSLNFIVRDGRAGRRSAYTAAIGKRPANYDISITDLCVRI